MAGPDFTEELKRLDATLTSVETVLDPGRLRAEIADLAAQASAPDLWDDPDRAQRLTSRLAGAQSELARLEALRRRVDDLGVLWELAELEDDAATRAEAQA